MPLEATQSIAVGDEPDLWRPALVRLGLVWLVLILAFAEDWQAMVGLWWGSSTYNHILLVPPILAWLVALRWPAVRQLPPQVWAPGLVPLALVVLLWVLGSFASFNLVRQAAVVLAMPASLLLVLGPRVALGLLFPLAYMAFLVPFGDELVPQLQMITADLTTLLVKASGIPALIDGVFIETPFGLFEVAEACSGVKFLIAMIALGALVANVCFGSWHRRVLFMLLCLVAPVLANGVRAWGTIYAAKFIGAQRAGGFDHIVYGWVFFALVIGAVLGLSWRFFDRAVDDPMIDPAAIERMARHDWLRREGLGAGPAILLCLIIAGGGQIWARTAQTMLAPLPAQIFLPDVPGWNRVGFHPRVAWQPRAAGAEHRLIGSYADQQGRKVDVFLALYPIQSEGREASGFGEGALPADSAWAWSRTGPAVDGGKSDLLRAHGSTERLAETYYRNGALLTGSGLQLKLASIADRLLLRREPTVMLILSAEQGGGAQAEDALNRFRQATGPLGPWMDRIVALR